MCVNPDQNEHDAPSGVPGARRPLRLSAAVLIAALVAGCGGGGPDTLMSLIGQDPDKRQAERAATAQQPAGAAAREDDLAGAAGVEAPEGAGAADQRLSLMSEEERQEAEAELRRLADRSEQQTKAAPTKSESSWLKKLRKHADDALSKITE